MDLKKVIEDIEIVAEDAGKIPMRHYGKAEDLSKQVAVSYDLAREQNKNSLTIVDIETQRRILSLLLKDYSQFGVYTEEETPEIIKLEETFSHRGVLLPDKFTFVIDPIDGTTNFLNTNPANWGKKGDPKNRDYFGVQINLAHGNRIVGGVIHYPALKSTISTYESGPTLMNGKQVQLVEKEFSPSNPVRISSNLDPSNLGLDLDKVKTLFPNQVSFGSSCYNLNALLKQEMDSYLLSKVELLDFGCTALAYENAGGFFGDINSRRIELSDLLKLRKNGINVEAFMLLAPNEQYHRDMIDYMKRGSGE